MNDMKFCIECGSKLEPKFLEHEGIIPFCPRCNEYRFPVFSSAISAVILNKERNKTLFIKQYGRDRNILVAGYINKGETAEEALYREIKEEIGVEPLSICFQKSMYWNKSNTLIFNYYVVLDSMELHPNYEVDEYAWFDLEEALDCVAKGGLAEVFYTYYFEFNSKNVL